jgi:hypothetical protein
VVFGIARNTDMEERFGRSRIHGCNEPSRPHWSRRRCWWQGLRNGMSLETSPAMWAPGRHSAVGAGEDLLGTTGAACCIRHDLFPVNECRLTEA